MDGLNKLRISSNQIELVDFRISEQYEDSAEIYEGIYGINVAKVQEIISMPSLFDLPASPEYILGVFDLRGTVIPLVDLACWIGIKKTEAKIDENKKRVIITEFSNLKIGFVVHDAKLIRRISWSDIEVAHFTSSTQNLERGKITGTTRVEGGRMLLILDLESVIEDLDFYLPKVETIKPARKLFSGNVLIVDDSHTARAMLKKILKNLGFNVIEAKDGQSGINTLNKLYEEHKDELYRFLTLIVSDVEMPQMDGFHFAESVKNDPKFQNIPLIFNSSICDKYSAEKGKKLGAEAYLVKFNEEAFYEEISKILN